MNAKRFAHFLSFWNQMSIVRQPSTAGCPTQSFSASPSTSGPDQDRVRAAKAFLKTARSGRTVAS